MEGKKVGIVIPSFNQGKYIEQTILSVLENKKYCDIDLVVMDGGSTDETLSILERYQTSFYYWRSEKDGGQADAVNQGMKHLQHCNYLMWLNSDDVYQENNSVKKLLDFMCSHNVRAAYGKSYFIDKEGEITGEYPTEEFSVEKLGKRCYISQPSVMIEEALWEECGGLNPRLQMCLDYEMWIRIAKICAFGFCGEYIGNTRMYEDTKTATMHQRHLGEVITVLDHYYGRVPTVWIYVFFLEKHSFFSKKGIWNKVEKGCVYLYVLLRSKKLIQEISLSDELQLFE